jgi:heat shock protein HtpX
MGNNLKTAFLLTAMTVFVVMVGQALGGRNGAVMALCLAAAMNFFSYFFSDKMAIFSSGAQPVSREQLPRVYQIVERLCAKTGLPMPKIFVIPTGSPNAFATGRNPDHASLAVTAGILDLLNDDELEGVLAHDSGAHGRLCRDVRRRTRPRPRWWRWRDLGHCHDDPGTDCGHADPDGGFALA